MCCGRASTFKEPKSASPQIGINPEHDIAALPFSSGTTGRPKCTIISHGALVAQLNIRCDFLSSTNKERTRVLQPLPIFHSFGSLSVFLALKMGHHVVLMPKYEIKEYVSIIDRLEITTLLTVPTILVALTKHPSAKHMDGSSVQTVCYSAMPAGEELQLALMTRFGNLKTLCQVYGLTEVGIFTSMPPMPISLVPLRSCGILAIPRAKAKFVSTTDPSKTDLNIGEVGELWIWSPESSMKGYLNRPEETSQSLGADGWIRTGDVGYADAAGFIYITDRLKEFIKYKGYQVAPAEVEDVLLKHSCVQEVCVTGILTKHFGGVSELVTAFVVLKPDFERSEILGNELKEIVAANLAPYKQLRGGVHFVKEIPKTGSGKYLRRKLRNQYQSSQSI